ncbi:DUF5133 domain-containing protein [Streptomyces sp. NBC_01283]|uniref:DUF5133 domain-containing protein n=1 Tax=Streptomyces sp. NBC_01283 TaxID=2903812 RepID=UPI00352ECA53|nr:DUF5133 domain-containing protein [Streptomyces sp. NBC_01283]
MLRPHPTFLHTLLETYSSLLDQQGREDSAEVRQRLDDVSYTLCVSTGTRTPEAAVAWARAQLAGVLSQDDARLSA